VLEERQEGVFPRVPGKLEFENVAPPPKPDVSVFDLLNAVNSILKRFEKRDTTRDIFEDKWSVSEKIENLMKLTGERTRLKFSELFAGATSRPEVIVTFLALLELIRLKQLIAAQLEPFGEIEICRTAAPVEPVVKSETEGSEANDGGQIERV